MLDFVAAARTADWYGGTFALSGSVPERLTEFGMDSERRRSGYVHVFDEPSRFENGRTYVADDVLHTHPAWVDDGMILGIYPETSIGTSDEFLAHVGLLAGARSSDGVEFEFGLQRGDLDVPVEPYFNGDARRTLGGFYRRLARASSFHDGQLETLRADLREFSTTGRRYRPVLIVRTAGNSGQDWAAWVRPRIEQVRSINIPHAQCILESTSGNSGWIRNRRRRTRSDELGFFINAVCLDEREVPIPGTFQAQFRSATDVDSGDFAGPAIDLEFVDPAIRYAEIRMIGLEIDGTGATAGLAEYGFNNWSGTFFLTSDGSRYAFNQAYDGPRSTNNHDLLFADYWIVDFDRFLEGGRDPVGRAISSPSESFGSVEAYLTDRQIKREIRQTSRPTITTESRRYTAAGPDSIYEVRVNYR
jgi:hypothetical protein